MRGELRSRHRQECAPEEGRLKSMAQLLISPRPSFEAAVHLLRQASLPTQDLTPAHCEHFFFAGPASQPTGLVGLEFFDDVALLRSLVVAPERRGTGEGAALLRHAEQAARTRGVREIYLLTTTAEAFFVKHGYEHASRDAAPMSIRATAEFAGICPASSAFMKRRLPYSVLILCTGNSARSILGEALVNHWGGGRFIGYSAGSSPKGRVHPIAMELLTQMKMPTAQLRSKSWDEFARPDAPRLDFVFTVCDNAAGEACPVWPGQPISAHWGVDDPAAVEGSETDRWLAFRRAFREIERRVEAFTSLPIASLDRARLQERVREIGAA
jgi:protein-tyrosine-phosphatase/N-acetylglutamate synthase-like GNAT family acetyltransferase